MVEWKKLGEIATLIRGRVISKDYIRDFEGEYPVYSSQTANDGILGFINSYMFDGGYLTWTTDGAYAGTIFRRKGKFSITNVCGLIDITYRNIQQDFLYFWLSKTAKDYVLEGMGNPKLMSNVASTILIPIPSLSEQQRIVGILDSFTSSIENLKEQIAQRRKQYEYYRDQLLDLEGKEGVEMKTLSEICEIKGRIGFRGYTREDQVGKGEGALSLAATNIANQRIDYSNNTYITWEKYYESPEIMVKNGDIIVCQRGSIGKIAYVENLPEKATINPQLLLIKNIKINNKYLIHVLLSRYFQDELSQIIGHGTVQMIAQKDFKNLLVPVPSISEQQRIVSILDTFEASVANLEHQLAQREKQYEYYRNKLLTFE